MFQKYSTPPAGFGLKDNFGGEVLVEEGKWADIVSWLMKVHLCISLMSCELDG
jgi:hypothetical protein